MKIEAAQNTGFVGASNGTRPGGLSTKPIETAPADWVRLEGGSRYVSAAMQTNRSLSTIAASAEKWILRSPTHHVGAEFVRKGVRQ